jgi:hypothetical protein
MYEDTLRIKLLIACSCFALLLAKTLTVYAQTEATLTLLNANVTAGDSFEVKVTLDSPAPCPTQLQILFSTDPTNANAFWAVGDIPAGAVTATLKATTPKDQAGGDYKPDQADLRACPGFSKPKKISVPARIVTVRPVPDPNHYPAEAELTLSITQKQFLDTKIVQLDGLDSESTQGSAGMRWMMPTFVPS